MDQSNNSGIIKTSQKLDREEMNAYTLLVRVEDKGVPSLSSETSVKVELNDINDHVPVFDHLTYTANVSENAAKNSFIVEVNNFIYSSNSIFPNILMYLFLLRNGPPMGMYRSVSRENTQIISRTPPFVLSYPVSQRTFGQFESCIS